MELAHLITVLRRRLLFVIVPVLLGLALSLAYVLLVPPQYVATAKVFVSVQQASSVQDLSQGSTFTQQVVKSYADVVATPIVLDPVIRELGLKTSALKLAERVNADAPLDTVVLEISARDNRATTAAQIANAVSASLANVVATLAPNSSGNSSPVKITKIQSATAPQGPDVPDIPVALALGLAGGLAVGVLSAFLRDMFDTRVRNETDIESATNLPLLGAIGFNQSFTADPILVRSQPNSESAEAFRTLRTNLQFVDVQHEGLALVVTSSIASEGKSTTAANLGAAVAAAGRRTLLIDADLRRPRLAELFRVEGAVGLTDVLIGATAAEDAIQQLGNDGLHLLPAGTIPPNPAELLGSTPMRQFMEKVRGEFDAVIVDAPPLGPVSDAAILVGLVQGAVLVCAARKAHKGQIQAALSALSRVDAPVVGVVATMLSRRGPDSYRYSGYSRDYSFSVTDGPVNSHG